MDNKQIWDNALVEIELSVSKANFSTWFKDTYIIKNEDGVVQLAVPNPFVKTWLQDKYHKFIFKSLRNLAENVRSLEYIVAKEDTKKSDADKKSKNNTSSPAEELPLTDLYINKEDNLNPRYTFDAFVVGPFNELAHAAAQAIVKKPGMVYNPLFIHGNTGHGKTHLIQSIGNTIKKNNPDKKVFYVSSERFVIDLVNSIQSNKVNNFKESYRKYDVLIMDDIQFIANKEKSQEELFHLFNTLYDNNKQIIFSSDKHPNFIPNLEDRLKSRFAAGMIVDIPPPDNESRQAILKTKLKQNDISLPQDIIDFIAVNIEGSVRELEGIVNNIVCQTNLKNRELNFNEIKNLTKDNEKPKKATSIKDVIKIIADFYNIEEGSIYEKTRRKEIVKPRQLAMYILREECSVSYPLIGQKLGGRDHTTVIHSCEKIKREMKSDHLLAQEINQIKSMIV
ncbi:MAG: chromosomal replication initiator protein DnaA [Parcubacteria group bacterium CG11_big_fil_rev_8_21_14_0_20_39_22]|nr:MAG: chromosomal replication initiator protein DnaA [Parcubacteria group bacterium CG11_big_fil_rev_8_21_14_0_20_39_22]